jgi:N-methylhydantoinase A
MMRIAIDIGGTFTDLVTINDAGELWSAKLLTTPADPSRAFLALVDQAIAHAGTEGQVREIVHATTVATNAILEGHTSRMGMITTAGFKDVLEIGRHFRRDIYNFFLEKPPVLIPRQRRLEVSERLDASGAIVTPLDEEAVRKQIRVLSDEGVEVIVIGFLNSYVDPKHEQRTAELVAEHCDIPAITSHSVCGEYREYERFSTAAVHAAVMPTVRRYLTSIRTGLSDREVAAPLTVMQSSGGLCSAVDAMAQPGSIVESGPAAGVISAVEIGRRLGLSDLISFDMGGTTAKATLIQGGRISINSDYEVGGGMQGGFGTGYPIRTPVIDLVEIGTGGGSLAAVDEVGQLHVGPRSAGADPGPACYGRGGKAPTITDANLVLGRLSAKHFAGGQINLDVDAARQAVEQSIAAPLELGVEQAAHGIVALANAQMVRTLQFVSIERGYDPRDFTMIAFGGAGPMHAAELAIELGCRRVIVPPEAGVQSAWGLLVADARRDFSAAVLTRDGVVDLPALHRRYDELVGRGTQQLKDAGFSDERIEDRLAVDVRYLGQAYELTVALPEPPRFDAAMVQRISDLFHERHQAQYGHSDTTAAVAWVTMRAAVTAQVPRPPLPEVDTPAKPLARRQHGVQNMTWNQRRFEAPLYLRSDLGKGDQLTGPALIVQDDTSLAIPPQVHATVEPTGDLILNTESVK